LLCFRSPVRQKDLPLRRHTIGLCVAFGWLVAWGIAAAQQPARVVHIGLLAAGSYGPDLARNLEALRHGLRDLGWVEGQNLVIEFRNAEGDVAPLPTLATELVQRQIDIMVTLGGAAVTRAAKDATSTIPIVMLSTPDPVRHGFIASLAHPGGNLTGTASLHAEVGQKRLELLMEAGPGVSRIAVLHNRANPAAVAQLHEPQGAAQARGVERLILEPHSPDELERVFTAMLQAGVSALLVLPDPFFLQRHLPRISALVQQHRLPAMYPWRMYVDAGGLMSYGMSLREAYLRTAYDVDRMLQGTKPAALPVEQPMRFEFIINLQAAKALDRTRPPVVLSQADEVLQ
jgi:putative tryptophan/tyrosine transport system substrate-binding protein